MPALREHTRQGLHLGWIPNDPGRRPRDFAEKPPTQEAVHPQMARGVRQAKERAAGWIRLLAVTGALTLLLCGLVVLISHRGWFWGVAAAIAVACWGAAASIGWSYRRAIAGLRRDEAERADRHAAELVKYEERLAAWQASEAERVAGAPKWLRVTSHEDISRLDVFGGTAAGRRNMLTGAGLSLLRAHAVIVLDLSADRLGDGLLAAAERDGLECRDYRLPRDLRATPLLSGLSPDQIASQIVEVTHADDPRATAAGRAADLLVLNKINRSLGGDVSMARLHEALCFLLDAGDHRDDAGDHRDDAGNHRDERDGRAEEGGSGAGDAGRDGGPARAGGVLSGTERESLRGAFGEGFRKEVGGALVRLAAVVEPLRELGMDAAADMAGGTPAEAASAGTASTGAASAGAASTKAQAAGAQAAGTGSARLTCLSLGEGPRDVAADLTAALMVQWATQAVVSAGDDVRPAIMVAGADEQDRRHLARLTAACDRHGVPLIRTFSRLTEESARHLDSRNTAFMRLPTRPEALRAAEHIGMSRRFVASRLAVSQQVSRSRTKTVEESVTHTTGVSEGGSVTRTAGTTEGESYTETETPFRRQHVTVNVQNNTNVRNNTNLHNSTNLRNTVNNLNLPGGKDGDNSKKRDAKSGNGAEGDGGNNRGGKSGAGGGKPARGKGGRREGGWSGGSNSSVNASSDKGSNSKVSFGDPARGSGSNKPDGIDIVKSRTKFSARHQSESKTKSWEKTEQTSHTTTQARSKTEGTSVGDEVTYDLTYEHKVRPETLMDLPEDQMLAPHITESGGAEPAAIGQGESRMVALVVDPGIVGLELAAPVTPDEIPAYEAPPAALPEGVRVRADLP